MTQTAARSVTREVKRQSELGGAKTPPTCSSSPDDWSVETVHSDVSESEEVEAMDTCRSTTGTLSPERNVLYLNSQNKHNDDVSKNGTDLPQKQMNSRDVTTRARSTSDISYGREIYVFSEGTEASDIVQGVSHKPLPEVLKKLKTNLNEYVKYISNELMLCGDPAITCLRVGKPKPKALKKLKIDLDKYVKYISTNLINYRENQKVDEKQLKHVTEFFKFLKGQKGDNSDKDFKDRNKWFKTYTIRANKAEKNANP